MSNCDVCGDMTIKKLVEEHNSIHAKINVFSKMNGEEAQWVTRVLEGILKGE